jgi:hypothetical protein
MPSTEGTNSLLEKMRRTDVVSRLRSYNAPMALERTQVHKTIADAKVEMENIKAQIVLLEYQYRRLEAHVELHQSFLAPIYKLPDEILGHIFLTYRDGPDCPRITMLYSGNECVPLKVAAVCHHWRNIALSMPSLWSRLKIAISEYEIGSKEYQKKVDKRIDLLIERSGDYPLDVELHAVGFGPEPFKCDSFALVKRIFCHFDRCRSARLDLGDALMKPILVSDDEQVYWLYLSGLGSLPLLESLELRLHLDEDEDEGEEGLQLPYFLRSDVLTHAPMLKELKLHIPPLGRDARPFILPLSQLKRLDISVDDAAHALTYLRSEIGAQLHLDALHLKFTKHNVIPSSHHGEVVPISIYSKYVYLEMWNIPSDSTQDDEFFNLLKQIKVFGIESLEVNYLHRLWTATKIQTFKDAIQPSMNTLSSLQIVRALMTEEDLLALLILFPVLHTLGISEGRYGMVGTRLLRALSIGDPRARNGNAVLLPYLKILRLEIACESSEEQSAFRDMVLSRWAARDQRVSNEHRWASLSLVSCELRYGMSEGVVAALSHLKRVGFGMSIVRWYPNRDNEILLKY